MEKDNAERLVACLEAVVRIVEGINGNDPSRVAPLLSDGVVVGSSAGNKARKRLLAFVADVDDKITDYEILSADVKTWRTQIDCRFMYGRRGAVRMVLLFDRDNRIASVIIPEALTDRIEENYVLDNDRRVTRLPFRLVKNLILIRAKINGKKRWFLLDTGAPGLIVHAKYVPAEELEPSESNGKRHELNGIGGKITQMNRHWIDEFDLQGIKIESQEVFSMDMTALEKSLGHEISGLVGFEVMKDYDVVLDYDRKEVLLIEPESFGDFFPEDDHANTDKVAFDFHHHLPVVGGIIGNERLNFAIDSGAESNLLTRRCSRALAEHFSRVANGVVSGADAQDKPVTTVTVNSLMIGPRDFRDVETILDNIDHLNHSGRRIDGICGYQILSRQKTIIRYQSKELWFVDR